MFTSALCLHADFHRVLVGYVKSGQIKSSLNHSGK